MFKQKNTISFLLILIFFISHKNIWAEDPPYIEATEDEWNCASEFLANEPQPQMYDVVVFKNPNPGSFYGKTLLRGKIIRIFTHPISGTHSYFMEIEEGYHKNVKPGQIRLYRE
jgi:hypothetical protein